MKTAIVFTLLLASYSSWAVPDPCEHDLVPTETVDAAENLTPPQRRLWEKIKAIPHKTKAILDTRIQKGELNPVQMNQYLGFLIKRADALFVAALIPSFAWGEVRNRVGLHDVLSLHQSNFLRGIAAAAMADAAIRRFTRDDSRRTALLTCTLLGVANAICETPWFGFNNSVDVGDLVSGELGVLVSYVIYRLNEYQFSQHYLNPTEQGK